MKDDLWTIFVVDYWHRVPRWIRRPKIVYDEWREVRKFPPGTIIEDCRYHPCVIQSIDGDGNITSLSMLTGYLGDCSLFHCGIVKLSYEDAGEYIKAYRQGEDNFKKFIDGKYNRDYDPS